MPSKKRSSSGSDQRSRFLKAQSRYTECRGGSAFSHKMKHPRLHKTSVLLPACFSTNYRPPAKSLRKMQILCPSKCTRHTHGFFRFRKTIAPFLSFLKQKHRCLVNIDVQRCISWRYSGGTKVVPLPHCMGMIFVFWYQKSGPVCGARFRSNKILALAFGRCKTEAFWDHCGCQIPAPKRDHTFTF